MAVSTIIEHHVYEVLLSLDFSSSTTLFFNTISFSNVTLLSTLPLIGFPASSVTSPSRAVQVKTSPGRELSPAATV